MAGDSMLFDDADLFTGDPIEPDFVQVCPPSVVATLTRSQREARVTRLVEQAHQIVDRAWDLADGRMRAAWCILYSGGNDSTVLAHMMRHRADYAVHANTTIGVEETRQFVRDTCAAWDLPLIERVAPQSYRDLVIERGFPGPAMHFKMYQRLKERPLDLVRSELVTDRRRQRVLFIAGRRRAESKRRVNIPLWEVDGSAIWASPLAMWTKLDMNTYRLMAGDVPVNPVSDKLHMSGECLCGAFAKPDELDEIRFWYPDVAAEIDALERDVAAAGHREPYCRWGHGKGKPTEKVGPLCTSCDLQLDFDTATQQPGTGDQVHQLASEEVMP
jgi:3'-phosphoadenosine 5'-phosphosulfate sulfotransferase (PAPS reductase)/FAD synthetase